ncbi:hypothetical protein KUF71_006114 [Frankliniella fusca]|uniref:Uncharacterized protein n=1 Tax=Frankliniella fusca TaxID=407009 RepID=A0AAE1H8L7_9NEOP|nr:hypothetical protein KUF71_006114 [Frankliniella fusca]
MPDTTNLLLHKGVTSFQHRLCKKHVTGYGWLYTPVKNHMRTTTGASLVLIFCWLIEKLEWLTCSLLTE